MSILLKKVIGVIGIDKTIFLTIVTRVVQTIGSLGVIVLISKFLTNSEQGYYYTFSSIIAIQIFFELGLSGIITQYAAHEFANLKISNLNEIEGSLESQSRLSSLLHFCIKWFAIISFIFLFVLVAVGYYFFKKFDQNLYVNWQRPWIILSISTSLNLFIDPILAFFDGIGKIKDMAKMRLIQKASFIVFLIVFFSFGLKLYSLALASLLSILINYIQIVFTKRFRMLIFILRLKNQWSINYLNEIFPYQWRIALSWISGYFIFQLFNPILFATEGAIVAGRMGMTLQALNGISALSMSWIVTKVPILSQYIAKKDYSSLDNLFDKTLVNMLSVNVMLLLIFIIGIYILNVYNLKYAYRFLPILPTMILSLTCFVNQIIFAWATYLRCHKKEPFLLQSIVFAVLVSLSTIFLGKQFGMIGIVTGYGSLVIFLSFGWSYKIFTSKKKQWHL